MRQRSWQGGTERRGRRSAGCRKRRGRWPGGRTGSSRTPTGASPGCGGTVAIQEEGKTGGRKGWASEGKVAPGGGARSRGASGGAAGRQLQPGADADGLGLEVATAAAICAAAGAVGSSGQSRGRGGGAWRAGLLREVGPEDESGAGEARDPPFQRPGRQGGGGAREKGPEIEEGRWGRMLGGALPGASLDCP